MAAAPAGGRPCYPNKGPGSAISRHEDEPSTPTNDPGSDSCVGRWIGSGWSGYYYYSTCGSAFPVSASSSAATMMLWALSSSSAGA